MPWSVTAPRLNANDVSVRVTAIDVEVGDEVAAGEPLADLLTDKATVTITAERDGFVIALACEEDEVVAVGAPLLWMGESADESLPQEASPPQSVSPAATPNAATPTLKARGLLRRHGLSAADVPASGERLTADDVARFVALRPDTTAQASQAPIPTAPSAAAPVVPAPLKLEVATTRHALEGPARGMLKTVCWQRDHAVPAYLEIEFDADAWAEAAARFGKRNRLLLSPLVGLMAHRLVQATQRFPDANATIDGDEKLRYASVGCASTVQAGDALFLVVIHDAQELDALTFVQRLTRLQKRAHTRKLSLQECSGATIGFSSLPAVRRHVPVLAPNTALMVAHASGGVLGATYDHRVLTGATVARILKFISTPPADESA